VYKNALLIICQLEYVCPQAHYKYSIDDLRTQFCCAARFAVDTIFITVKMVLLMQGPQSYDPSGK
jgi:hypothetical protein